MCTGVIFEGVLHCVHFVKDGESKMCDDIKANGGLGCPVVVSMMLEAQGTASAFDRLVPKNDDEPINEKHIAPYSKVLTNSGKEVSKISKLSFIFDRNSCKPCTNHPFGVVAEWSRG